MAEPLLTLPELNEAVGYPLTGGLQTQAERYLRLVSAEVRQIAKPYLDEVEPPNVPDLIQLVMTQIMRRVMHNPNALSGSAVDGYQWQASGQTGPFVTRAEASRIRSAVGKNVNSVQLCNPVPVYPSAGLVSLSATQDALNGDLEE